MRGPPIRKVVARLDPRPRRSCPKTRTTQGSVQIVLIFRLLLKITVDWPFHAISSFLKPARAPPKPKRKKIREEERKIFSRIQKKNQFGSRRRPLARTVARRAPLAERSAVNRQVLGSIPSAGVIPRPRPLTGGSSGVEQWTVKCLAQLSIGREFKSPSPDIFFFFFFK